MGFLCKAEFKIVVLILICTDRIRVIMFDVKPLIVPTAITVILFVGHLYYSSGKKKAHKV